MYGAMSAAMIPSDGTHGSWLHGARDRREDPDRRRSGQDLYQRLESKRAAIEAERRQAVRRWEDRCSSRYALLTHN